MRYRTCILILAACAVFVWGGFAVMALDLLPDDLRPGIGDEEDAKLKIQNATTKDEVRSVLGRPHRILDGGGHGDAWYYRNNLFWGSILRVDFRPDGSVKSSECWVN
jgi:outer membrane protein assembly factor BamE (lipoprotein component of BamABCDE complex)